MFCEWLSVDEFKWVKTTKIIGYLIKSQKKNDDVRYIFEAEISYPEQWEMLHIQLSFLVEKIKKDQYENTVCNLNYKKSYVIHILNLKSPQNV